MSKIKRILSALAVSTTLGQCLDLPFHTDPVIQKSIQALACELNLEYPARTDGSYIRDAYHKLNQGQIDCLVDKYEKDTGTDGRFVIALEILREMYSKEKLGSNGFNLMRPLQTHPTAVKKPIIKLSPIGECEKRLRESLTREQILAEKPDQKTIAVALEIIKDIPLLPNGILTVWEVVSMIKEDTLDQQKLESEQATRPTLVEKEENVDDSDLHEIALSICLDSLRVRPLGSTETPNDRIIALVSETGIAYNLMQDYFFRALSLIIDEKKSEIQLVQNELTKVQRELNESETKQLCGELLSEQLSSSDLNNSETCDLAIAIIMSMRSDVPHEMLLQVLDEMRTPRLPIPARASVYRELAAAEGRISQTAGHTEDLTNYNNQRYANLALPLPEVAAKPQVVLTPIISTTPNEQCTERLKKSLTQDQILAKKPDRETIVEVMSIANDIPGLPNGIETVWGIIDQLKTEYLAGQDQTSEMLQQSLIAVKETTINVRQETPAVPQMRPSGYSSSDLDNNDQEEPLISTHSLLSRKSVDDNSLLLPPPPLDYWTDDSVSSTPWAPVRAELSLDEYNASAFHPTLPSSGTVSSPYPNETLQRCQSLLREQLAIENDQELAIAIILSMNADLTEDMLLQALARLNQ